MLADPWPSSIVILVLLSVSSLGGSAGTYARMRLCAHSELSLLASNVTYSYSLKNLLFPNTMPTPGRHIIQTYITSQPRLNTSAMASIEILPAVGSGTATHFHSHLLSARVYTPMNAITKK